MLTKERINELKKSLLSPHFTYWEAIKSNSYPELVEEPSSIIWNYIQEFAQKLEEFRSVCCENKSMIINSWYRNPKLNNAVGGKKNSIHMILDNTGVFCGVAADVTSPTIDIFKVFQATLNLKSDFKTFILYPKRNFIHVDTNVKRQQKEWFISMVKNRYDLIPNPKNVLNIKEYFKNKYNFEIVG